MIAKAPIIENIIYFITIINALYTYSDKWGISFLTIQKLSDVNESSYLDNCERMTFMLKKKKVK